MTDKEMWGPYELLDKGTHILKPNALILYSDKGDAIMVKEIPLLRQRIAELEKEVEAAEKRGFEAVKSKAIDAMAIDIAADHPSKDGYDESLFSINSVADYLDDAYADYKKQKSLKG